MKTSILAALLTFCLLLAQQVTVALPSEDPRSKEYKALLNKITQGKYEEFRHLPPEKIIEIWAELLGASGKHNAAAALMIKVIDAQTAKYGDSDLRVAASFKRLGDIEFVARGMFPNFFYCKSMLIQQEKLGFYNELTAATLCDFSKQLGSQSKSPYDRFLMDCLALEYLKRQPSSSRLDECWAKSQATKQSWMSDTGEWIDTFEPNLEKPISVLAWYKRLATKKAKEKSLKSILRELVKATASQLVCEYRDFIDAPNNQFNFKYINPCSLSFDQLTNGSSASLAEARTRLDNPLPPGHIECSSLRKDGALRGILLRVGDPSTGFPLKDEMGKCFVVEAKFESGDIVCEQTAKLTKQCFERLLCGVSEVSPVEIVIGTKRTRESIDYAWQIRERIKRDWLPPPLALHNPISISFDIKKNGEVHSVKLKSSSRDAVSDEAALESIRTNYAQLPLSLGEKVHVDVNFGALCNADATFEDQRFKRNTAPCYAALNESERQLRKLIWAP